MPGYEPFPGLEAWAGVTVQPEVLAEIAVLVREMQTAPAEALFKASEWILRAAAVDTGALEQLYPTDRGFTMTVAASGAGLDAILSNQPDAARHIRDQIAGFEFVLDMATELRPFSAQSVRELHAILTSSQETYKVLAGGQLVERPLPHGVFKDQPNNPTRANGSIFSYADPLDVDPEMARLVDLTRSDGFASLPVAVQAALVHYAFVRIHPFADGNGRVARAIASWPTYQALRCPILIFADERDAYLDALEAADAGRLQAFVDFISQVLTTGIRLLNEQVRAVTSASSLATSLEQLRALRNASGGLSESQRRAVSADVRTQVDAIARQLVPDEPDLIQAGVGGTSEGEAIVDGWRINVMSDPTVMLISQVGDARRDVRFRISYGVDSSAAGIVRVRAGSDEIIGQASDVYPAISVGFVWRLRAFMTARIAVAMQEVVAESTASMRKLGFDV